MVEDAMFVSGSIWQELRRRGLWDICQNYEKIIMTNKKIILEWKKIDYHYIMRNVRQNQLIIQKKIILAHKRLIRNRKIICLMDKNNFKEAK